MTMPSGGFRYWADPDMEEWLALDPGTPPRSQISAEDARELEVVETSQREAVDVEIEL